MHDAFEIPRLGDGRIPSPLQQAVFVDDDQGILLDVCVSRSRPSISDVPCLEAAGPRRDIFFDPRTVRAAMVTCGGLCPGLNDVIRGLTMVLWYRYGMREILGIRYGYFGLTPSAGFPPVELTPESVEDIHQHGGSILGTSRGPQDPAEMTEFLVAKGVRMLFTIGGDGTQRGALALQREIARRGLDIAVIGIPKTIDNDVSYTERTFGFETAVALSQAPIASAHMEAKGVQNGVGLVKLMGRESGFIAAYASLASSDVNLVLVPEVPFSLERLYAFLRERLARKTHAVIVAAEGAGQNLVCASGTDASGNAKLGDIGLFLKQAIKDNVVVNGRPANVRYLDPSYAIRSAPASADDSVLCFRLAENAVHAAMAGRTGMVVGLWNSRFVHVPMERVVEARKKIDPRGPLWQSVLDNTGQPVEMT